MDNQELYDGSLYAGIEPDSDWAEIHIIIDFSGPAPSIRIGLEGIDGISATGYLEYAKKLMVQGMENE